MKPISRPHLFFIIVIIVVVVAIGTVTYSSFKSQGVAVNSSITTTQAVEPGTRKDFLVNAGDRVFFGTNSADLSAEAHGTLDKQAAWLKKYPQFSVTIEGHCDEKEAPQDSTGLGEQRAEIIKNYLVTNGVSADRIKTVSYGSSRPAAPGHSMAFFAQNRRGVTVLTP